MKLDIPVYRDDDLWIGALPVNERYFRGEKDQDVYGLLPRLGVNSALRDGAKGEEPYRVRPKEISLPITLPSLNKQRVPDQAWLNVGKGKDLGAEARRFAVMRSLADASSDPVCQAARRKEAKEVLGGFVPLEERGPQYLAWDPQSLDFSSRTDYEIPSQFIERLGDGLMDGGDYQAFLMQSHSQPFAGGSLVGVSSDHPLFQDPALIAVVVKKKKRKLMSMLGRESNLPEQLTQPSLAIRELDEYRAMCRKHPIVQGHMEMLAEFFPGVTLHVFTDRDYPALVRNIGSDFRYAYHLRVEGEVTEIPEVRGKKLAGFFSPNQLSDLLIPHRASKHAERRAVWSTKTLEQRVFNRRGNFRAA